MVNKLVEVNHYDDAIRLLSGADGTIVLRTGVAPAALPEGWNEQVEKGSTWFVHKATLLRSSEHPACIPPDVLNANLEQAAAAAAAPPPPVGGRSRGAAEVVAGSSSVQATNTSPKMQTTSL